MDGEASEETNEDGELERGCMKAPPDKQSHFTEVEYYTNQINEKEALYKSITSGSRNVKHVSSMGNPDDLLLKLKYFDTEKEKRVNRKQVIDAELKELSHHLQKKTETCAKLQASLRYKNEQRTDDAIKRLEKHLSTQQLKLSEEKKLVSEIDALRRSKKTLSQYVSAKQEEDQLRHKQGQLRGERDTLIRETREMKSKENDVKGALDVLKAENEEVDSGNAEADHDLEALRKEISLLHEKRRELRAAYKQEVASFHAEEQKLVAQKMKVKEQEKREERRISRHNLGMKRQTFAITAESRAHEDETKNCASLIYFLEPLRTLHATGHDEGKPAGQAADVQEVIPKYAASAVKNGPDGSFLLRKSDEDFHGVFTASSRRLGRKGSRKGRRISCQKVVLHPQMLEQFFKLGVDPPSTCADVARTVEQLKVKQEFPEKATQDAIASEAFSSSLYNVAEREDQEANTRSETHIVHTAGHMATSKDTNSTTEDPVGELDDGRDSIHESQSSSHDGTTQESETSIEVDDKETGYETTTTKINKISAGNSEPASQDLVEEVDDAGRDPTQASESSFHGDRTQESETSIEETQCNEHHATITRINKISVVNSESSEDDPVEKLGDGRDPTQAFESSSHGDRTQESETTIEETQRTDRSEHEDTRIHKKLYEGNSRPASEDTDVNSDIQLVHTISQTSGILRTSGGTHPVHVRMPLIVDQNREGESSSVMPKEEEASQPGRPGGTCITTETIRTISDDQKFADTVEKGPEELELHATESSKEIQVRVM